MRENDGIWMYAVCCADCKTNPCLCRRKKGVHNTLAKKRIPSNTTKIYELNRAIARAEKHMDSLLEKILTWEGEKKILQDSLLIP